MPQATIRSVCGILFKGDREYETSYRIAVSDSELEYSVDCNGKRYYGEGMASFCANDVDKNPTDTVWRPMNIQIHRVLGTLYVVKK